MKIGKMSQDEREPEVIVIDSDEEEDVRITSVRMEDDEEENSSSDEEGNLNDKGVLKIFESHM